VNVLWLCNLVPGKCGAFEELVTAFGSHLREHGHGLFLVVAGDPAPTVAAAWQAAGVAWDVVPAWVAGDGMPRPWAVVGPAWRIIRRHKPDLVAVHFGNELPTAALILALKLTGCGRTRWVWHQHQQMAWPRTAVQRLASRIRLVAGLFRRMVVLYEGGRRVLLARGVRAARVCVIPNGTRSSSRGRPPGWLRPALGLPPDVVLVCNVSSLIPRKRVDLTLEAFARLRRSPGTARLLLVGTGAEEGRLRERAAALGMGVDVHFMGARDDVPDVLAEVDIVCLSSDAEACPYVLLEAMSLGKPCIATAAGAVPEIVVDGVTGGVVPCGDSDALGARLQSLLCDPSLRAAWGAAARGRWESRFTLDRQIGALAGCLDDLAGLMNREESSG
jgi:glycosyltransferase involved in cell wall biosynthesis